MYMCTLLYGNGYRPVELLSVAALVLEGGAGQLLEVLGAPQELRVVVLTSLEYK
mgnify:FL=1